MTRPIAVLYATVSGNAELLAGLAAARLEAAGCAATVVNLADFPAERLRELDTALLIASTWGDGAAPPDAAEFCAAVAGRDDLHLSGLAFAVFALGSSNYQDFCGCGRRLDADLAKRGARRLLPRVESDIKFKAAFERWLEDVVAAVRTKETER